MEAIPARERIGASLAKLRAELSEALAVDAQERWKPSLRLKQKRNGAVVAFRRYRELSQGITHPFSLESSVPRRRAAKSYRLIS